MQSEGSFLLMIGALAVLFGAFVVYVVAGECKRRLAEPDPLLAPLLQR